MSGKGNRWVERLLSRKETCRFQVRSTYTVLVDTVTSLFTGHPPDLAWLHQQEPSLTPVIAYDQSIFIRL